MKKTLLILVILLAGFAGFTQTEQQRLVTVKDTSYSADERLTFMVNTILPAVNNYFQNYSAKMKVGGENITFQAETASLVQDVSTLINSYAKNFVQISVLPVDSISIIEELNLLNARIATLQQDPNIKYLEEIREFKEIQERQAKLSSYYEQIKPAPIKFK
jgi:hypothetical protein